MQLLVAQLEHQDPTDPTSGTEFVTQLAQFSELSNSTSMLADLDAIKAALTTPPSSSSGSGSGSQSGTQQTGNS